MKHQSKKIIQKFLAFIMCFSLLHTSLLIFDASAEEEEPVHVMVRADDFLAARVEDEHFYFYYPYSECKTGAYKGISYDAKTNTLKLVNADAPFLTTYIHSMSNLDAGTVTVSVEGNCKIGAIAMEGPSTLSFTGSGNLTINAPYTGKLKQGTIEKQVSNAYPANYQYWNKGAGIVINSEGLKPSVKVGKDLTMTVYGNSDTGVYDLENYDEGSEIPGCIRFAVTFDKEAVLDEKEIITYGGTTSPAFVWDSSNIHTQEAHPECVETYYAPLKLSYDKVYFGIDKDGKCEQTEDNMYVKRTYTAAGHGPDYHKIVKNENADGYSIALEEAMIDSDSVSQNMVKARTFTNIPYDSTTGQFSLNQATDTKNDEEYRYSKLFHKDNKDYVVVQLTGAFTQAVIQNTGMEIDTGYASTFGYAPYKDGSLLDAPVSIMDRSNGTDYMLKNGYTCNMNHHYYSNATLKNLKQVFSPAGGSSSSSGGGGAAVQPASPTTQAKAPEKGQQETVNGDKYQVTSTGSKTEVEYQGTENSKEKTVTVDSTVKIGETDCSVTSIGKKSFAGNTAMQQLTIPATVEEIKEGACSGCKNLKKFTVNGKGLKKIGKNAFSKCPKLTAATLPDSVTEIGKGAFDGDSKLGKMTVNGNNLKKVGKNALRGIKKNATITIKAKNKTQYNKTVNMIKKAGNKKLKFKFKKYKK